MSIVQTTEYNPQVRTWTIPIQLLARSMEKTPQEASNLIFVKVINCSINKMTKKI